MNAYSVYIEWDEETNLFIGSIKGVTGAHTYGATLDELYGNLFEVLDLCIEEGIADYPVN